MTLIIGLTGGIGSGKSTVSRFFSECGVQIIDADLVARQVVEKGQPALSQIAQHFGHNILLQGALNRALLRTLIFQNEDQRLWLNNLLQPLIRQKIMAQLSEVKGHYALLEAPLLFEHNLDKFTDYDLVVDINERLQLKRACQRDNATEQGIKAIIKSQIDRPARLHKADFIINNSDLSMLALQQEVQQLDGQFRQLKN